MYHTVICYSLRKHENFHVCLNLSLTVAAFAPVAYAAHLFTMMIIRYPRTRRKWTTRRQVLWSSSKPNRECE